MRFRLLAQIKRAELRPWLIRVIVLAAIYALAAKLGLSLAAGTPQVTALWPPTGLALAALLILGYRLWPGILLGAFVANLLTNEPAYVAAGIAAGNTLEALAGSFLLNTLGFRRSFERIKDLVLFGIFAAVLSTAVSASIGTLSLALGDLISWRAFQSVWFTWWTGDMMGALIFAPPLLAWAEKKYRTQLKQRLPEGATLLFALLAVTAIIFNFNPVHFGALAYIIVILLVWAAFRFTQLGATTSAIVVTVIGVLATIAQRGPFFNSAGSLELGLILLLLFSFSLAMVGLLMAIAVSGRNLAIGQLEERKAALEKSNRQIRQEVTERKRLAAELKEANERVTKILAGILDDSASRRNIQK